jgi:hypothetical protein
MQAGFARYGQERLLFRGTGTPLPPVWSDEQTRSPASGRASRSTRCRWPACTRP